MTEGNENLEENSLIPKFRPCFRVNGRNMSYVKTRVHSNIGLHGEDSKQLHFVSQVVCVCARVCAIFLF